MTERKKSGWWKNYLKADATDTSSPVAGSVPTKLLVEKLNYELHLLDESINECDKFTAIVRYGKLMASRSTLQEMLHWVEGQNKQHEARGE